MTGSLLLLIPILVLLYTWVNPHHSGRLLARLWWGWVLHPLLQHVVAPLAGRPAWERRARLVEEANQSKGRRGVAVRRVVGFLHPYCNAGGGGERVLWCAVRAVQEEHPEWLCVVYTGDVPATGGGGGGGEGAHGADKGREILDKAKRAFGIDIDPRRCRFVGLGLRWVLDSRTWPRLTLVGQAVIGATLVGMEAALRGCVVDVCIDSMGYAAALPVMDAVTRYHLPVGGRSGRRKTVGCYVHYPTISTDMLGKVDSATGTGMRGRAKAWYYRLFSGVYGEVGRLYGGVVMCNSTWTYNHIAGLWGSNSLPQMRKEAGATPKSPSDPSGRVADMSVVYPPCNTEDLCALPLELDGDEKEPREPLIISIGQFRPEKDHPLMIRAFGRFLAQLRAHKDELCAKLAALSSDESEETKRNSTASLRQYISHCDRILRKVRLVLIGGVRDQGDRDRVEALRRLAAQTLKEEDASSEKVLFEVGIPYSRLRNYLARSSVGIHCMWNEHFGIGVVEYMAAGLIPLAHRSGGPLMDIVDDCNGHDYDPKSDARGRRECGYLAWTEEEYSDALIDIFTRLADDDRRKMQLCGRKKCTRFSEEAFASNFLKQCEKLLSHE
eukprot:Nk52_evm5s1671 gene=Nk52_evmTU5s1671